MVAFLPVMAMIAALFGMGAHVLKPRLPHYTFQVKEFPLLRWINGNWKTRIGAGVKLQNDNYVPIDVHALSFDLFYPDWQGTLVHIGQVQDKHQQQQQQPHQQGERVVSTESKSLTTTVNHKTSTVARGAVAPDSSTQPPPQTTTTTKSSFPKPPTPLWKLLPRAQFETFQPWACLGPVQFVLGYFPETGTIGHSQWRCHSNQGQSEITTHHEYYL
jgi:hypothetical protein